MRRAGVVILNFFFGFFYEIRGEQILLISFYFRRQRETERATQREASYFLYSCSYSARQTSRVEKQKKSVFPDENNNKNILSYLSSISLFYLFYLSPRLPKPPQKSA